MSSMDRRRFLQVAGVSALALGAAGTLAACGSSDSDGQKSGGDDKVGPLKLASSSSPQPTYLTQVAGPVIYGEEFGLKMTMDDIVIFQSHATAVQATLSGQVQAVGASTMAHLTVAAQGSPFKIFQPFSIVDDYILVSNGKATTIEEIKTKNVTVGIDSLGGAAHSSMDAMLIEANAGFLVGDLENVQGIESSGERQAAFGTRTVDVTMIHPWQAELAKQQGVDYIVLSSMYEGLPNYLNQCYAAPTAWLEKNLATATALSASVIKASQVFSTDEQAFLDACKKILTSPPSDQILQDDFELMKQYAMLPSTVTGLEPARLDFMIDLGKKEGILTGDTVTAKSVVDGRANEAALKLVGSASPSASAS